MKSEKGKPFKLWQAGSPLKLGREGLARRMRSRRDSIMATFETPNERRNSGHRVIIYLCLYLRLETWIKIQLRKAWKS